MPERRVISISDEQAVALTGLQQDITLAQNRLALYAKAIMAGHGITRSAELIEIKDGKKKKLVIALILSGNGKG